MTERKVTTTTPLKITLLGNLPNEESWRIWAKKINGEWSSESPALATPFTPPDNEFDSVGEC